MTSRVAVALILSVAGATTAGCNRSDIDVHEAQWEARAKPDYRFAFHWSCFCSPDYTAPVDITVTAGAISSITDHATGAAVPQERFNQYRTIAGLFDFLHEAERKGAAQITVTWDPIWSYPATAFVDYVKAAADDEMAFSASDLSPLP